MRHVDISISIKDNFILNRTVSDVRFKYPGIAHKNRDTSDPEEWFKGINMKQRISYDCNGADPYPTDGAADVLRVRIRE